MRPKIGMLEQIRNKFRFVPISLFLIGAGCLNVASAPATVTKPVEAPPLATKTYSDTNLGFTVQYPDDLTPIVDRVKMRLTGYIPACDPDHAIVCFPLDTSAYSGTNFESAAFGVQMRDDLKGQAACAAPSNGETALGVATINGTAFNVFSLSDSGAGHHAEGQNFRVFRDKNCLELSTRIDTMAFENWPPGTIKRFTEGDQAIVQLILDGMRKSFTFEAA